MTYNFTTLEPLFTTSSTTLEPLFLNGDIGSIKDYLKNHIKLSDLGQIYDYEKGPNITIMDRLLHSQNRELLDFIFSLYANNDNYYISIPLPEKNPTNFEIFITLLGERLRISFFNAVTNNDLKSMIFYESLQNKYELGDYLGLNERANIRDKGEIRRPKYLLNHCFAQAVHEDDISLEVLDFIVSHKEKYGGEDFTIAFNDILTPLIDGNNSYDKADYLRDILGYNYNTTFFAKVYDNVKNKSECKNIMNWLILEHDTPFNDIIKQLIEGDLNTQNIFLYKKLQKNDNDKGQKNKIKL